MDNLIVPVFIVIVLVAIVGGNSDKGTRSRSGSEDQTRFARNLRTNLRTKYYEEQAGSVESFQTVLTQQSEVRFELDKQQWTRDPQNGRKLIQMAQRTIQELYIAIRRCEDQLKHTRHKDNLSKKTVMDLRDEMDNFAEKYIGKFPLFLQYSNNLKESADRMERSLSDTLWQYSPGAEDMNVPQRLQVIKDMLSISQEYDTFQARYEQLKTSYRQTEDEFQLHRDEPDPYELQYDAPSESDFDAFSVHTDRTIQHVRREPGRSYHHHMEELVFENDVPSIPDTMAGSFKRPLSLEEMAPSLKPKLPTVHEFPSTPPGQPAGGSPAFKRIAKNVREIIEPPAITMDIDTYVTSGGTDKDSKKRILDFLNNADPEKTKTEKIRADLREVIKYDSLEDSAFLRDLSQKIQAELPEIQGLFTTPAKKVLTSKSIPTNPPATRQKVTGISDIQFQYFEEKLNSLSDNIRTALAEHDKSKLDIYFEKISSMVPVGFPEKSWKSMADERIDIKTLAGEPFSFSKGQNNATFKLYENVLDEARNSLKNV